MRPGFSVCALRTSPQIAAPARSVIGSPGRPTAPWVTMTRVAAVSAVSQDCSTCKCLVGRRVHRRDHVVIGSGLNSQTTTSAPAPCAVGVGAAGVGVVPRAHRDAAWCWGPTVLASMPVPAALGRTRAPATAAWSCSGVIGRVSIEATDNTGSPAVSASSSESASGPAEASRARTREAPAACNDTCCQQNGTIIWSVSDANPAACNAASSSTGWIPNPAGSTPSGRATSAKTSLPRRHIAPSP